MPGSRESPSACCRGWTLAALVGAVALAAFGVDLGAEPHFVDESAFISQAYFADLWLAGARDDPAWLDYPAYDLPPLPKYLIGLSLRAGGFRRPGPAAMQAWYGDTSRRFETPGSLWAARWPSAVMGAIGCVALFALGLQACGPRVGLLAAALLIANPLYRQHARRAMADAPAEALILATAAVNLWSWRRTLAGRSGPVSWTLAAGAVGVLGGLAVEAKLNGGLGLMIVAGMALLSLGLTRFPLRRRLAVVAAAGLAGGVAFGTFVALNPFLTAHPPDPLPPALAELARLDLWGRTGKVLAHRLEVPRGQQQMFPHNALTTPTEKLKAVAVQGFGRFGPLGPHRYRTDRIDGAVRTVLTDSTVRYDWPQDWGAVLWLPLVVLGLLWAARRGLDQYRDGSPPAAWAVLVQTMIALATVTAFIPLAWDRYYLSIQPVSSFMAAGAIVAAGDRLIRSVGRREEPRPS